MACETVDDELFVYIKTFVLLYADDTVIISENRNDMKTALKVFEQYCEEWKLTVNIEKANYLNKIYTFSGGKNRNCKII